MNMFYVFYPKMMNWFSIMSPYLFMPVIFSVIYSQLLILWKITMSVGYNLWLGNLFIFVGLSNFFGLFPYVYTHTAMINICMSLAFIFWFSLLLYSFSKFNEFMFSHLTPNNAPMSLAPMLVLVELISQFIRPITLSVRLSANMIAGHLLLMLIPSFVPKLLMMLLETMVTFIQSYIFMLLIWIYMLEL